LGLIRAARELRASIRRLRFGPPVSHVYNPLEYAWAPYEAYLRRFAVGQKPVLFLGMNPGPFGMVQTGVPFGQVRAVRDWLGLEGNVGRPCPEHPKRRVLGFDCPRSEVSGERLWSLFEQRFGSAQEFFKRHLVLNYCPLAFMEESGRNLTPDKLPAAERTSLFEACDRHLRRAVEVLQPQWVIGIGDFARRRAELLFSEAGCNVGQILHPSPANPTANRSWSRIATAQLEALGAW